ncbi:hypothetical protein [Streptomyces flaveus]|uniref:hypothetical protein n=1 Tax=Streptomyces flaveus TaxID=66370 RepID=UPI0033211E5C
MPLLGSALAAAGILGDSYGWWEGFGFLTNLISSFTGLMFAVPFALVVLSRLGEAHAELAERRSVRSWSNKVVSQILQNLDTLHSLRNDINQILQDRYGSTEVPPLYEWRDRVLREVTIRHIRSAMRRHTPALREFFDLWRGLDDIRSRRRETGLAWISATDYEAVAETSSSLCHPDERWQSQDQRYLDPMIWDIFIRVLGELIESRGVVFIASIKKIEEKGISFTPTSGVATRENLNEYLETAGLPLI